MSIQNRDFGLKKAFAKLYVFFGLRHRKIFTRDDRLRLRFVVPLVGLFLFAAFILPVIAYRSFSVLKSSEYKAASLAGLETVDGDSDHLVSEGIRQAVAALKKPKRPHFYAVKLPAGGTIAGSLQEIGLSGSDAYYVVKALSEHYDVRSVRAGQLFDVHVDPQEDGTTVFEKMIFKIDPVKIVTVVKEDEVFTASLEEKKLVSEPYAKVAVIETSLYGSAARAGIPAQIIAEVIRAYSWDVDFQRDIRRGDTIEVLYDVKETEDGEFASYGDIAYAKLTTGAKEKPIFRYELKDGRVDYFEDDGRSVKKTLMKTPVDGARLSSGFGMRRHPVLGYNKMHKGVDFAAPTGTPIYAAGDGVVDYKGRKGGYGNYIRLRHNASLKTAYAHMHKFAKGMGVGKRVEQGDVIGYIGTTGRSTGPHLHYEVLLNGQQVNPNRVDLPVGEALSGAEFSKFKALKASVEQEYHVLAGDALDLAIAARNNEAQSKDN